MLDAEIAGLIIVDEVGPTAARVGGLARTLLPAYRRPSGSDAYFVDSGGEGLVRSSHDLRVREEDDVVAVPTFTLSGTPESVSRTLSKLLAAALDCASMGLPGSGDAPAGRAVFDSLESFREFAEESLDLPVTAVLVAGDAPAADGVVPWRHVAPPPGGEVTLAYALTAEAAVLATGAPASPLEGSDGGLVQAEFGMVAWSGRSVAGVVRL